MRPISSPASKAVDIGAGELDDSDPIFKTPEEQTAYQLQRAAQGEREKQLPLFNFK